MCNDVFGILYSNVYHVSGDGYQIEARDDEHFLREVISPIYDVLMKVSNISKILISFATIFSNMCALNSFLYLVGKEAKRSNKGKASHSKWRNYDDLNEYFW